MTRVNAMGPLARRQFRTLKWLGGAYFLVTLMFLWFHWTGFASTAEEIWQGVGFADQRWAGPVNIFGRTATSYLAWLMLLTVLMVIYQQVDAYVPRTAQLMGSMPVTRGRMLQVQLLSGLSIILGTMALHAVGCCLMTAHYQEIFELDALISPIPGQLLGQLGPFAPLVITLRISMILVSVYLLMSALIGLFGNALIGIGMLISLCFWYTLWLDYGHANAVAQKLHTIGFMPDFSFRKVLDIVSVGVSNTYGIAPYLHYQGMPWDALPWFVPIHLVLWVVGIVALWQQRKHLAVEQLGGFFLFQASRWAVLGLMMIWVLPLPLLELTVYDMNTKKEVFNPLCLILLIPAVIVFVVGHWLLIRRPQIRLNKRLAALALAVLLMVPMTVPATAEFAEPEFFSYGRGDLRIGWRYEPSKLQVDDAWGKKIDKLTQQICDIVQVNRKAWITDDPYYSDYGFSGSLGSLNPMEVYNESPDSKDFARYQSAQAAFVNRLLTVNLVPKFEPTLDAEIAPRYSIEENAITERQMVDALKECGFVTLAVAFEMRTEEQGTLHQNGLWLELSPRSYYGFEDIERSFIEVNFYADSPFTAKSAEQIDGEIMKNPDVRRVSGFSNGVYDTMSYEFYSSEAGLDPWLGTISGTVILKDGVLWRLMLSVPSRYPALYPLPLRAAQSLLDGAVAQGALQQADVEPLSQGIATWQAGNARSGGANCTLTLGGWPLQQEAHWMVRFD